MPAAGRFVSSRQREPAAAVDLLFAEESMPRGTSGDELARSVRAALDG
ncbi:MAG TPA: hypothetical protein VJO12_06355 [Stellaceae bacterium]|nr:hypothetical protein [Stellaceae bacterium]